MKINKKFLKETLKSIMGLKVSQMVRAQKLKNKNGTKSTRRDKKKIISRIILFEGMIRQWSLEFSRESIKIDFKGI